MYSFNLALSVGLVKNNGHFRGDCIWVWQGRRFGVGTVEHLYRQDPEYALTGLTDGFVHYQDVLKKRYKDFELGGSKTLSVNNATVSTTRVQHASIGREGNLYAQCR